MLIGLLLENVRFFQVLFPGQASAISPVNDPIDLES
jgi:hypothetical protein